MSRFYVVDTFALKSRQLFVLFGSIEEGGILKGMLVHIPLNSATTMTAPIDAVEALDRPNESFTALCVKYEDDIELAIWQTLNICNEVIEVSEPQDA